MPKTIEYPTNCTFRESLEISKLINKVGGKVTISFIADNLKVKEGTGSFRSKISSALKYGMIEKKGNNLFLTDLGQKYFHPINDSEKDEALKKSLLSVPIFKKIIESCAGQEVDKKFLESMLIRIFEVNEKAAGKVAWYLLKANEEFSFLEKRGKKFLIPIDFVSEETPIGKNEKKEEKFLIEKGERNINLNIFNLLIAVGKKDVELIKEIIEKKKDFLSHAEVVSDFLDKDNSKSFESLIKALKKDLKIKEEISKENILTGESRETSQDSKPCDATKNNN